MKRAPAQAVKLSPDQIREIEHAVFELALPQIDESFYLLAVSLEKEAGYWYLRVYVEGRDSAISLNDCERISLKLDPVLDELPLLRDFSYSLEVSSPGLFRPLKTQREFDFYQGRPIRIEAPAEGKPAKKALPKPPKVLHEGQLTAYNATRNTVILTLPNQTSTIEVSLADGPIVRLNPSVRFPEDDNPDHGADMHTEQRTTE